MSSDPVAASIATSAAVEQETTVSGASECSRARGRAAAATAPAPIQLPPKRATYGLEADHQPK